MKKLLRNIFAVLLTCILYSPAFAQNTPAAFKVPVYEKFAQWVDRLPDGAA